MSEKIPNLTYSDQYTDISAIERMIMDLAPREYKADEMQPINFFGNLKNFALNTCQTFDKEVNIHRKTNRSCYDQQAIVGHLKNENDSRFLQHIFKDHDCLSELPHLELCSDIPVIKEYKDDLAFKSRSSTKTYESSSESTLPTPVAPYMDWNNYHRLSVIHQFMEDLEYDFPSICTSGVIGHSIEGRELKILKISNSHAANAGVWLDAGIHAREWIAPAVATYIADHIARNFDSLPKSMTNKDWYFLPVVNPDGYEHSHTKDRMWRKNRAKVQGQYHGVDLNRNFSIGWGERGSSDIPSHAFYRGPHAFSEPESCAVRDMLSTSGVQFKIYITLHSYGQVIVFPFAYRDQVCPDYIRLLEGATVMSKAIYEASGNIYKVGISRDVMYGAAGTSNDWSYGHCKIPYCYLIELRSKKHKFKLPKDEIELTCKEILSCVKALVEFVDSKEDCDKNGPA